MIWPYIKLAGMSDLHSQAADMCLMEVTVQMGPARNLSYRMENHPTHIQS